MLGSQPRVVAPTVLLCLQRGSAGLLSACGTRASEDKGRIPGVQWELSPAPTQHVTRPWGLRLGQGGG